MMTDLSDLIARVEGAGGPDPRLDQDIYEALRPPYEPGTLDDLPSERQMELMEWDLRRRDYTASIDAAVALAGRVLPGWRGLVRFGEWPDHDNELRAVLWDNDLAKRENVFGITSNAATPALALVAAVLKAVQAQWEAA